MLIPDRLKRMTNQTVSAFCSSSTRIFTLNQMNSTGPSCSLTRRVCLEYHYLRVEKSNLHSFGLVCLPTLYRFRTHINTGSKLVSFESNNNKNTMCKKHHCVNQVYACITYTDYLFCNWGMRTSKDLTIGRWKAKSHACLVNIWHIITDGS